MKNTNLTSDIIAQGFAAIGSESRLEVLKILVRAGNEGLSIGDIQQRTGIAASTLAHHLKFLVAGGLIYQHKEGRSVISKADYEHIRALSNYLLDECCIDESCGNAHEDSND